MIGAFLIGGPRNWRNRNLFSNLLRYAPSEANVSLLYSIATSDDGCRVKVGGITRQLTDELVPLVNPFSGNASQGARRFDNHYTPLTDGTTGDLGFLAPDILMLGDIDTLSVPSRGTSVSFSGGGGCTSDFDDLRKWVLNLVSDDRQVALSAKVYDQVAARLHHGNAAQVCTLGPSVTVLLAHNGLPIYTYLVAQDGNMYFVWATHVVEPVTTEFYVWPVGTLMHTAPTASLGLNLMAIRHRWYRNNESSDGRVDATRLAKAIALVHRWIDKHTITKEIPS